MQKLKIKSVKKLPTQDVYDITMPNEPNFLLENGVVAHNCAHAVSYAILAYNGAYLKYHYPLEFWVGELSINFRKRKKILAYLKECRQHIANIDIKTSGVDEWDIIDDKIIPPLGVVKGLGPAKALSLKNLLLKDISEVIEITEELDDKDIDTEDSEESNDTDD
jgi:DNA polymerase-3 subunit alpha